MSIVIEQITDEPVLVFTLDDDIHPEELSDAYLHSIEMARDIEGGVYRIIDMRSVSDYENVVATIQSVTRALAGGSVNPQLLVSFVGQPHMAWSDMPVLFFDNMEDALEYAGTTGKHALEFDTR